MSIEDQLRERLKKVEALYFGAATAGERVGAEAALARLKAKLDETGRSHPPIEMKFTAGPVVGPPVHRVVPALWPQAVPLSAAAPHHDHGQGAATFSRDRAVAAILRAAR